MYVYGRGRLTVGIVSNCAQNKENVNKKKLAMKLLKIST